jgi:hypothetical protein
MSKRMTPIEALESLDCQFDQGELFICWAEGPECYRPTLEIMSWGYDNSQARRLWNARPKTQSQWNKVIKEYDQIRELKPHWINKKNRIVPDVQKIMSLLSDITGIPPRQK